ncbi:MAG: MBL fold metallo-hydrolase [Paludibacteraceae bacterium]|nr:MBL fold metallo-hydrolase [Paludibacteraceae bacterium]
MKIKIIVDNYATQSIVFAEHGFSALICDGDNNILFDTASGSLALLHNLECFKVAVEDISSVVLSHGHNDHSGGVVTLMNRENDQSGREKCQFWAGKGFDVARTGRRGVDIGLKLTAEQKSRFKIVDGKIALTENVYAVSAKDCELTDLSHIDDFYILSDDEHRVSDNFDDEVYMVCLHDGKMSIITGCAHRGVTNIVRHAQKMFNLPVDTIIGGFHTLHDSQDKLAKLAAELQAIAPRQIICGHCTGVESYAALKTLLPETVMTHTQVGMNIFV